MSARTLWYYAHRFGGQDENLARAHMRFDLLTWQWRTLYPERLLWAPWLALASVRVSEGPAWDVIYPAIAASDGVVLDLDGAPMSSGMRTEEKQALRRKAQTVLVDGDLFDAVGGCG